MNPQKLFAKKVFWALDAFHDEPKDQLRMGKTLNLLFAKENAVIQPVSVLLPGRYNPEALSFPIKWNELAGDAKKNLKKLFKEGNLKGIEEPRLIKQKGASVKNAVMELCGFAMDEGADLIAVSSHSRKGLSRFLIGSFAETLVLNAPLPVLVINPKWVPGKKMKHILFPTDFSPNSRKVFDRVLVLAKELQCEILLMHAMEISPYTLYPLAVPPVSKKPVNDLAKDLHEKGDEWVRHGRLMGAKVKFYLSKNGEYALEAILRIAKKMGPSGMIAMASQSEQLESILLGSLTRQVIRSSPCPVLTVHPDQESLMTKTVTRLKRAGYEYTSHPILS